jgi:diguanylate cyclase (GGDEF)-like protein
MARSAKNIDEAIDPKRSIQVLLVTDGDTDGILKQLHSGGYNIEHHSVDNAMALSRALREKHWDLVISDYRMANLNCHDALKLFKRTVADCPFIVVSASMNDEAGIAMMKAGAHDYVMSDNLPRLLPVIERELEQAAVRRQLQRATTRLEYLEYHDVVTNLPNASFLNERLAHALRQAERNNHQGALLVLRIERFRTLNETLGDQLFAVLLMQFGRSVRETLDAANTVSFLRANEFAVLLPVVRSPEAAVEVIHEITKALERPFMIGDLKLELQVSFGVALFPDHATSADLLVRKARVALSAARKSHSPFAFFSAQQAERSGRQLTLASDLRRAILENQLFLLYQPKIDLSTFRVTGVEALVRWKHPQQGILTPEHFIPLAEETGFIMPLTLWVLNEACRQCRTWNDASVRLTMAVNLSPWNLQNSALAEQIKGLLASSGVPADQLELEITESAIMANPQQAAQILGGLRAMGIRLVIDDFGTGYSSLAHLQKFPVDVVKIDKSFVMQLATAAQDAVIVRSIIYLAHNLELKVVAEGVENRETIRLLAKMGCDMAQGHYISHPRPAGELPPAIIDRMGNSLL